MGKRVKLPGRAESAEMGGIVTGAGEILDDLKGKTQEVINTETDAELVRLDETKQGNLTFDQTPTKNSTNPVTSGGVYDADQLLSQAIEAILLLIPSAASALNQLADKTFVRDSISSATATFRGTFNVVSDLHLSANANHAQIEAALNALSLSADSNDYCFVQVPDTESSQNIKVTERYKFNGTGWAYEYDLNNSGFTSAQWAAINSNITAVLVSKLSGLPTNEALTALLAAKQDNLTFDDSPASGSNNPVKSGGIYTRNNEIIAMITALDAAKQDVLTFDITPMENSTNPVTSNGVYQAIYLVQVVLAGLDGRLLSAEHSIEVLTENVGILRTLYQALSQSDIIVGAKPATGVANIIYRVPGPSTFADWMYYNGAWVKLAEYTTLDGYLYKGIATPTGSPAASAVKMFYFAMTAGTYTNFGNLVVTEGISILKYDGANWTQDIIQGVDDEPNPGSLNLVKSGGVYYSDFQNFNGDAPETLFPFIGMAYSGGVLVVDNNGRGIKVVPVRYGTVLKLKAQNATVSYLIVKSFVAAVNAPIDYASGESGFHYVSANQEATITITQSDAKYVIFRADLPQVTTAVARFPLKLTINQKDFVNNILYGNSNVNEALDGLIGKIPGVRYSGLIDSNIYKLNNPTTLTFEDNKILKNDGTVINMNNFCVSEVISGETVVYFRTVGFGLDYANVVLYKNDEVVKVINLNKGYHTVYVPLGHTCRVCGQTSIKYGIKSYNIEQVTETLKVLEEKIAGSELDAKLSGLVDANIAEVSNPSSVSYTDETALLQVDGTTINPVWASTYRTSSMIPEGKIIGCFLRQLPTAFVNFQLYKNNNVVKSFWLNEGYHFLYIPLGFTAKICTTADKMQDAIVGNYNSSVSITEKLNQPSQDNPLHGVKISWYGTSIPAQGYPSIVGTRTGATVTNEAQGSSMARRGAKSTTYQDDPYKVKGLPWSVPVRGLMMSVAERNDIITNWLDYVDTWAGSYEGEQGAPTGAKPHDINDGEHEELKSQLRNMCYDVMIARHCGIDNQYNTGTVDVSDIYVIEHAYNDVQPIFNDANDDYTTLPADPYDRNHPIGAINAMIKYIYEHNPHAKIALIGHYECNLTTGVHSKSVIEKVAEYWSIPLLRLYDVLGFNQRTIPTNGYWDTSKVWHDTGFSFVVGEGDTWTSNNYALAFNMVAYPDQGTVSGSTISGSNATRLMTKLGITPGNGNAIWNPTRQEMYLPDNLHPSATSTKGYFAEIISNWLCGLYAN